MAGKTFTQIKTALADWIGPANLVRFPNNQRGDIVNIVQRKLCRLYDLRYFEKSDTFATVASTRNYTVPSDWSRPHSLWYLHPTSGGIVTLDYLLKEQFDQNFPDSTKTGLPTAYTIWGTQIQLGKTPDRVVTINRNYYQFLTDLSLDGDTNALTDFAWEALLFLGLEETSRYLIEDPRVPVWKAKAREIENELTIEHARARSAGRRAESQEPG